MAKTKKTKKAQEVVSKSKKKSSTTSKPSPGQPTKYKPEYNNQAYKLCLLGSTDKQLGDFFEVDESTINNWKIAHPKFLESIKKGKVVADAEVAEKLYHRALGYEHPEDKIFCTDGKVTTVKTTKHYPPDTAAAFIWLKNRAGWKDKQEHEHGLNKETMELLGMIDGSSKGQLPDAEEGKDAGQ